MLVLRFQSRYWRCLQLLTIRHWSRLELLCLILTACTRCNFHLTECNRGPLSKFRARLQLRWRRLESLIETRVWPKLGARADLMQLTVAQESSHWLVKKEFVEGLLTIFLLSFSSLPLSPLSHVSQASELSLSACQKAYQIQMKLILIC